MTYEMQEHLETETNLSRKWKAQFCTNKHPVIFPEWTVKQAMLLLLSMKKWKVNALPCI